MAKFKYTVTGESDIHPGNLPEGFTVKTQKVTFNRNVDGFELADSAYEEGHLFVNHDPASGRHLSRDRVRDLRNALTEWLNESDPRRIIHDKNDGPTSIWRWYEIRPNKFVYELSEDHGKRELERYSDGRSTEDLLSFEDIKERFGVRTVIRWEV